MYMQKPSVRPRCHQAAIMRQLVDKISSEHELSNIVKRLPTTSIASSDDWSRIFSRVVGNMMQDGQRNWGRLIVVYALGGHLAREAGDERFAHIMTTAICDTVALYFADWKWDELESTQQKSSHSTLRKLFGLGGLLLSILNRC